MLMNWIEEERFKPVQVKFQTVHVNELRMRVDFQPMPVKTILTLVNEKMSSMVHEKQKSLPRNGTGFT